MASFNNNYSELLLLSGQNIKFWNDQQTFELIPMSLSNILFNESLGYLIGILDTDIEDLKKQVNGFKLTTHYEFFHLILSLAKKRDEVREMGRYILEGLQTLIPEVNFDDGVLKIKDFFLEKQLFNDIVSIVFLILGRKKVIINDDDDEFTKMEKEAILRAERIRAKGKKKDEEKGTKFEDLLASLIYEFPQYKLEDLFRLNIFTIHYLFKYVGKIANYEVSKIAAGNGLVKKHKYFIEK